MAKKPTPTHTPKPEPKPEPVKVEKVHKPDLATIGDIVIYHDGAADYPLLVTSVGPDSFGGQLFMDGTEKKHIPSTTFGADAGQCVKR